MTVSSIRHGRRLIVVLHGDLDMASAPGVLAAVDQLLAEQTPGRVVVDLARVDFLDSSGLAVMAELLKAGKRAGFGVVLVGATERHRRLLDIVRMTELFLHE